MLIGEAPGFNMYQGMHAYANIGIGVSIILLIYGFKVIKGRGPKRKGIELSTQGITLPHISGESIGTSQIVDFAYELNQTQLPSTEKYLPKTWFAHILVVVTDGEKLPVITLQGEDKRMLSNDAEFIIEEFYRLTGR